MKYFSNIIFAIYYTIICYMFCITANFSTPSKVFAATIFAILAIESLLEIKKYLFKNLKTKNMETMEQSSGTRTRKMTPKQARAKRIKATNEINIIYPYRTKRGGWVYDDEDLGVYSEAFVMGSSEVIDHLVGMNCNEFKAILSKNPIPEYTARLIKIKSPLNNNNPVQVGIEEEFEEVGETLMEGWYQLEGTNMQNWLCGCVLDYFENYPDNIYVKIEK